MRTAALTALILLLDIAGSFSQAGKELVIGEQPVYRTARATGPIVADGVMDEEAWTNARAVTFDYFFRRDEPLEKQRTEFRMLWDERNIYLFYRCEDTSITARERAFDGRPYLDDCAEFFVLPVPDSLHMHYGFEVNVVEARYDYVVLWQFHDNRTVFIPDYNPAYEVGVTMDGTPNDDTDTDRGWTMEYAIPLAAFRGFNTRDLAGTRWAFQAVRQDRNAVDDRFRSTSTLFPTYDVALDVHPPYRFGLMEFADD
ncbi:MAG: carbohydrate-binding family 9-like protein [Alistipes sp.]|jgi:hypothetical protein|nr:carbohydrate-binding family 9-like protein [Alistipes sp.]